MGLGWLTSVILYWRLRDIPARAAQRPQWAELWPVARRLFGPLLAVMAPREFMLAALTVYLPTFMSREGASLWVAGAALSIWELAGIGGALTSGTLSDRLGRKTVLLVMTAASSVFMLAFLYTGGWRLVPVLLALGFTSLSITPVMLAMVQEQLPKNRALANGLFLAMAFLLRPAAAFVVGWLGDQYGLRPAFWWAAVASLAAVPMVFLLPQLEKSEWRIANGE
jgi:FSR family fosmidomycin resistance protein-like MFS transporter